MHRGTRGFTLIGLMIVVAVIATLTATALPAHRAFIVRSADIACLGEAEAYAKRVVSAMGGEYTIPVHQPGRGQSITTPDATAATLTASLMTPGANTVTCDLVPGGACRL